MSGPVWAVTCERGMLEQAEQRFRKQTSAPDTESGSVVIASALVTLEDVDGLRVRLVECVNVKRSYCCCCSTLTTNNNRFGQQQ